jgi:hypothetical protein
VKEIWECNTETERDGQIAEIECERGKSREQCGRDKRERIIRQGMRRMRDKMGINRKTGTEHVWNILKHVGHWDLTCAY